VKDDVGEGHFVVPEMGYGPLAQAGGVPWTGWLQRG